MHYALFDFDGTLSVIRHGWEEVMFAVMVESICEEHPPTLEIEAEVAQFIDQSTGILTIKQMKWLEEAVRRHGMARRPKNAAAYKRIYLDRLLQLVRERLRELDGSLEAGQSWLVAGAQNFLTKLAKRGVQLFLSSGTDQEYVLQEAEALGIVDFFKGRIFGAQGDSETDTKEMIIQRILTDYRLSGKELLVVGDGPVEIQSARLAGSIALGVACNETDRLSWDARKHQRLLQAGADFIVSNFLHSSELVEILCSKLPKQGSYIHPGCAPT